MKMHDRYVNVFVIFFHCIYSETEYNVTDMVFFYLTFSLKLLVDQKSNMCMAAVLFEQGNFMVFILQRSYL